MPFPGIEHRQLVEEGTGKVIYEVWMHLDSEWLKLGARVPDLNDAHDRLAKLVLKHLLKKEKECAPI